MKRIAILIAGLFFVAAGGPSAESVSVRHVEGLGHGFLAVHAADGALLASGDQTQLAQGDRVINRIIYTFKDGSTHDETGVFSQRGRFQLLTYRLIQKGPAFRQPLEMTIDARSGQVAVHYTDDHGQRKDDIEHMDLPDDLSNGMMNTVLKNIGALPATVLYVAATPKPRLVKLVITSAGVESFSTAGTRRNATHYVVKVDLGGISGALAPLLGKNPPDSHVWILASDAPVFLRSEMTLFTGGPIWHIDPVMPTWSK